jgi:hypothetical protein
MIVLSVSAGILMSVRAISNPEHMYHKMVILSVFGIYKHVGFRHSFSCLLPALTVLFVLVCDDLVCPRQ